MPIIDMIIFPNIWLRSIRKAAALFLIFEQLHIFFFRWDMLYFIFCLRNRNTHCFAIDNKIQLIRQTAA